MNVEKNNKISIEEFKKLYDDMIKVCQNNIDYVESSIKFYEELRKIRYKQEPSKHLKNKHKKWKEKIEVLDDYIFKLYNDMDLSINTYIQLSNYKK